VWLAAAAALLLIALPRVLQFAPTDPDDYMRLAEVRDWLGGQAWFDVRQYRMDAPYGADMHWSRLADLPLAAFLALFRLALPEPAASVAAMTVVPLLQLLLAMWLLSRLMRTLGADGAHTLAAISLPPFFPLLLSNFSPLRIDHHGWQALGALAAAWLLVARGWRNAFAAGLVAAAWLSVSLEGLPLAALLGGLFGLRHVRSGDRGHEGYLLGMALGAPALFFATRPFGTLAAAYCDQLSWPHFLGFAGAALVSVAGRFAPAQDTPLGRFAPLALAGAAAAAAIMLPLGACAVNPLAGLDPVLKAYWLDRVTEGMPIWAQLPSVAAMQVWTIAVVVLGARLALRRAGGARAREGWAALALFALGAGAMSLLVMRAGLAAQLLAVPFAAVLVVHFLPRARAVRRTVPRILATVACLGFATPTLASGLLKPLDGWVSPRLASPPAAESAGLSGGRCPVERLNALPAAKLFAPLDLGPEIIARTPHGVVMSVYHRNQAKMREVLDAFAGPLPRARSLVAANHARYVVVCLDRYDLANYAQASRDNLAARILAGRPPAWLKPIAGLDRGSLRVYRFVG